MTSNLIIAGVFGLLVAGSASSAPLPLPPLVPPPPLTASAAPQPKAAGASASPVKASIKRSGLKACAASLTKFPLNQPLADGGGHFVFHGAPLDKCNVALFSQDEWITGSLTKQGVLSLELQKNEKAVERQARLSILVGNQSHLLIVRQLPASPAALSPTPPSTLSPESSSNESH